MQDAESIGRGAKWWLVAAAVAGVIASVIARPRTAERIVFAGETMGTTYRVVSPGYESQPELPPGWSSEMTVSDVGEGLIQSALKEVNASFNTYDPESDLSKFNAASRGDLVAVDSRTIQLLQRAFLITAATGGAFDPTVGPLVRRWQFGPGRGNLEVPTNDEVAELLRRIGTGYVSIDPDVNTLMKLRDGIELDLSAIAKGYGVDVVSADLDRGGFTATLTEIGGELFARGTKQDGTPWKVAVMNPADPFNPAARSTPLPLKDAGMATSGDYFNFHEVDGERYGHTIDPRTGRPVTHNLAAVTVIAPDCATADALATALMVMGPDEGYDWATEHDVAAVFTSDDRTVRETDCYTKWKAAGELTCRPSL